MRNKQVKTTQKPNALQRGLRTSNPMTGIVGNNTITPMAPIGHSPKPGGVHKSGGRQKKY